MLLSRIKWKLLHVKDSIEESLNLRHKLEPPSRLAKINIGNNRKIANEFFSYFVDDLNIATDSKILEVGSGFGRMAIPLTTFLNQNGSYDGIELIEDGVNWCQSRFTNFFVNFKFQQIDVYNSRYNPKGTSDPAHYRFPFKENTFNAIYLTSVFTHMYPNAIENYLTEIGRVLKPGERCLCTYYLYNDDYQIEQISNNTLYTFKFEFENYRVEDKRIKIW